MRFNTMIRHSVFIFGLAVQGSMLSANQEMFNEIVARIASHEQQMQTVSLVQVQRLNDTIDNNPVQRIMSYVESSDRYHVSIKYPGVGYPPPPIPGGDGFKPYVPAEIMWDGHAYRAFFPYSHQGMVVPSDTRVTLFTTAPVTNLRPFGVYSPQRLSQFLSEQSTAEDAQIDVSMIDNNLVQLVIERDSQRHIFILDAAKEYSPVEYKRYSASGNLYLTRVFEGYHHKEGIWIAQIVSDRSDDGTEIHVYQMEEWEPNPEISDSRFVPEFPEGTRVTDLVTDVRFQVPLESSYDAALDGLVEEKGGAVSSISYSSKEDSPRRGIIGENETSITSKMTGRSLHIWWAVWILFGIGGSFLVVWTLRTVIGHRERMPLE